MTRKRLRARDAMPLEPGEFGIAFQLALDAGQGAGQGDGASPWERATAPSASTSSTRVVNVVLPLRATEASCAASSFDLAAR